MDQSNTTGTNYGGTIYVYDGDDLMQVGEDKADAARVERYPEREGPVSGRVLIQPPR